MPLRRLLILLGAVTLPMSGCKPPTKSPDPVAPATPPVLPKPAPPENPTPPATVTATVPSVASTADTPPPAKEAPDAPKISKINGYPRLQLYEVSGEKTIIMEGDMRSQHIVDQLVTRLGDSLPNYNIRHDVAIGDQIRPVAWTNRVDTYWARFFTAVKDGVWEYRDGVVTLKGSVNSQRTSDELQRMLIGFMEGRDAEGIENELVVE